jgi:hypothetical protein
LDFLFESIPSGNPGVKASEGCRNYCVTDHFYNFNRIVQSRRKDKCGENLAKIWRELAKIWRKFGENLAKIWQKFGENLALSLSVKNQILRLFNLQLGTTPAV